ncbi:MAG: hypothetical protein F3745_06810, partial [Nitrospinae bacterium]|nr:hypothetical protein [Nitrospinota bacterium]
MRVQFSPSIDFNQMLVFSVFGHLLLLTVVLFLPKPSLPEQPIVPAFMVNLVSEPTGQKEAAPKRSKPPVQPEKPKIKKKVEKKKPVLKKPPELKKTPVKKKVPVSKPTKLVKVPKSQTPKSKGILDALSKLEGKMAIATPPTKQLVEELDQVARLEKPKSKPLPSQPIKKKSVSEQTFKELENLKNKKVNDVKAVVPVPLEQDLLKDFEELKMEETLIKEPQQETAVEKPKKQIS